MHAIAFFQWRNLFPSKIHYNREELEEILEQRIKFVRKELETEETISDKTFQDSKVERNFLVKYGIVRQNINKSQPFLINGF